LIFEEKILKIECDVTSGHTAVPKPLVRGQSGKNTLHSKDKQTDGKASWKSELGQAGAYWAGSADSYLFRADCKGVQAAAGSVYPVDPPA
jgi:hypothetical protein